MPTIDLYPPTTDREISTLSLEDSCSEYVALGDVLRSLDSIPQSHRDQEWHQEHAHWTERRAQVTQHLREISARIWKVSEPPYPVDVER